MQLTRDILHAIDSLVGSFIINSLPREISIFARERDFLRFRRDISRLLRYTILISSSIASNLLHMICLTYKSSNIFLRN